MNTNLLMMDYLVPGITQMPVKFNLTPEEIAVYRKTARRRELAVRSKLARRRERAWQVARQAAEILRNSFGAGRVIAFGSLAYGHWFSQTSDIDLAAWGLKEDNLFLAVARLQDLSPEFKVDLVRGEACPPEFQDAILTEGLSL